MSIKGFNIYEYYINKFINKCNPEKKFKLIFLAISPPLLKDCKDLDCHKYFYNPKYRDQLRDCVFAKTFLHKNLEENFHQREEFLCKLTRCGVILLDLVYFPTTQKALDKMISKRDIDGANIEEHIINTTLNNIKQLNECG